MGMRPGDAVLREVAAAIPSCLGSIDVACRYGGEELAVLLSDSSLEAAVGKAEQIRARIAEVTRASGIAVTASLSISSIPETSSQAGDLLNSADHALNQAKQHGRDRVVAARARASTQRLSLVDGEAAASLAE